MIMKIMVMIIWMKRIKKLFGTFCPLFLCWLLSSWCWRPSLWSRRPWAPLLHLVQGIIFVIFTQPTPRDHNSRSKSCNYIINATSWNKQCQCHFFQQGCKVCSSATCCCCCCRSWSPNWSPGWGSSCKWCGCCCCCWPCCLMWPRCCSCWKSFGTRNCWMGTANTRCAGGLMLGSITSETKQQMMRISLPSFK